MIRIGCRGFGPNIAIEGDLYERAFKNLNELDSLIDLSIESSLTLIVLPSVLIPFGLTDWKKQLENKIIKLKTKSKDYNLRYIVEIPQLDMTSLEESCLQFKHAYEILKALSSNKDSKISFKVNEAFNYESFEAVYSNLPPNIKESLIIKNNDFKSLNHIFKIRTKIKLPILLKIEKGYLDLIDADIKKYVYESWSQAHGHPIFHYYDLETDDPADFPTVNLSLYSSKEDLIIETKNCFLTARSIRNRIMQEENKLRNEWAEHELIVLSKSIKIFKEINSLFSEEKINEDLYRSKMDEAFRLEDNRSLDYRVLTFIWSLLKTKANKEEEDQYRLLFNQYRFGYKDSSDIKGFLLKLSLKYDIEYLKKSLYLNEKQQL